MPLTSDNYTRSIPRDVLARAPSARPSLATHFCNIPRALRWILAIHLIIRIPVA